MSNLTQSPSMSPTATAAEGEDTRQQIELIRSLLVTVQHFLGGFKQLFGNVTDPRHPVFITYPLSSVLATRVLMFLLRLGARRQVNLLLRHSGPSSAKFQALFGIETCPHGDTLDVTYGRLTVSDVQNVVAVTVETLIRKKVLYCYRLRGHYFLVAMDGTGVLTFPERHCPHCLTMTHNGRTTYYHPILEAKLVTRDGLVCSLMTEFIENPGEYPPKQDCELKAFYRLADRLKQRFPRLPICLLHSVSAKVFYLLLQLAHTLAQLIERGSLFRQTFPAGVGSAKNLAWRLLEAWRNARLSAQHIQHVLDSCVQTRFQPP